MESRDIFNEWTKYALDRRLKERRIDLGSMAELSKTKILAITGARRSGKSSVLMLLTQHLRERGEKVGFVNCEDSRLDPRLMLEEALKWFGDEGYLILDEITSSDDWEGWLSRIHDMLKGRLKVIVSSSRAGLVSPSKPLRGRMMIVEVFPLSFEEYLDFKGIVSEPTTSGRGRLEEALRQYLKFGGFPELAELEPEMAKITVLNDYFREILGLDVAHVSNTDISAVQLFGRYALASKLFSASKALNYFKGLGHKIGKEKMLQLEHYCQASYLFFFVPIFTRSMKDQSQYQRKVYPVDTGLFYAIAGTEERGRLLESVAFLRLRRRLKPGEEICYWRDVKGREVDFIIRRGFEVLAAYQVCYDLSNQSTLEREVDALMKCSTEFGLKQVSIITWSSSGEIKEAGLTIRLTPAIDWLRRD